MFTFSFSTKNIDVKVKLFYLPTSRDDNGVGEGGVEGWVPALLDFVLLYSRPTPHDGENFLTPSPPFGAP